MQDLGWAGLGMKSGDLRWLLMLCLIAKTRTHPSGPVCRVLLP